MQLSVSLTAMPGMPQRRRLHHDVPSWVRGTPTFFITICCQRRDVAQLSFPRPFRIMVDAVAHYSALTVWHVSLFLAMPDHVHALMSVPEDERLDATLRNWKRFVARNTGIEWQDGFFEHRIRSARSFGEKWDYIVDNPVRQKLVSRPEDWPFVWRPDAAD